MHCVGVLCQVVVIGCIGIINDEDVMYIPIVKQYAFGLYEGSDIDVF